MRYNDSIHDTSKAIIDAWLVSCGPLLHNMFIYDLITTIIMVLSMWSVS